jgi:cyclophilin family peptidyl-prolyl cis-trans isomerase
MYDNITFHRVIPQFMIQTGDPTATGGHNCGFILPDEIVPKFKFNRAGRLAMANIGEPNTGACQWFITETEYPAGDGKYSIFGQVMDGLDIVRKIARVITDEKDKPRVPVKLISVRFLRIAEPMPKSDEK